MNRRSGERRSSNDLLSLAVSRPMLEPTASVARAWVLDSYGSAYNPSVKVPYPNLVLIKGNRGESERLKPDALNDLLVSLSRIDILLEDYTAEVRPAVLPGDELALRLAEPTWFDQQRRRMQETAEGSISLNRDRAAIIALGTMPPGSIDRSKRCFIKKECRLGAAEAQIYPVADRAAVFSIGLAGIGEGFDIRDLLNNTSQV